MYLGFRKEEEPSEQFKTRWKESSSQSGVWECLYKEIWVKTAQIMRTNFVCTVLASLEPDARSAKIAWSLPWWRKTQKRWEEHSPVSAKIGRALTGKKDLSKIVFCQSGSIEWKMVAHQANLCVGATCVPWNKEATFDLRLLMAGTRSAREKWIKMDHPGMNTSELVWITAEPRMRH